MSIWLLRALAVLLAFGAGWSFGRAIPSWRIDRANEDMSRLRDRYHSGGGSSGGGGGCGYLVMLFFQGAWGALAMIFGAVVLAAYAWQEVVPPDQAAPAGAPPAGASLSPQLFLLLVGLLGYVVSRLTDKGPVGPLE